LSISIIIPTRNEEKRIGGCLASLAALPAREIIVVDGDSQDQTVAIAKKQNARIVHSVPGRGTQQHAGALKAKGDIFLFLHADTRLPPDCFSQLINILQQPSVAAGAFRLAIASPKPAYRLVEWGANLRSTLLQRPYGDQALFMNRQTYFATGGFPEQPIMEDVIFVGRLKKRGNIVIANSSVSTSARRWQHRGILATTLRNQLMLAGKIAGISPERLASWYYGFHTKKS
jgi:rSAM/selenodomain-associated transferase 2